MEPDWLDDEERTLYRRMFGARLGDRLLAEERRAALFDPLHPDHDPVEAALRGIDDDDDE